MSDANLDDVKLIVFDWDGTLMDSVARIVACMQAASTDLGIDVPSDTDVKEIIGLGLQEALEQLFPNCDAATRLQLTDNYRRHYVYESRVASQLFAGVEDVLLALRAAGYSLAIATGKARRGLDKVLAETNTAHFFAATRCADETRSKPHPQMLFELMDYLAVKPHQTLMVGDTEFDLKMATAAGMASMAVSYGAHEQQRLMTHSPLVCLSDIRQMPQWLPKCV